MHRSGLLLRELVCAVQGLVSELALVDIDKSRMEGEVLDLQHGMVFTSPVKVTGSPGPESSAGSDLVIITAGVRQREGEPRLSLVQRNVNIYKCEYSILMLIVVM